MKYFLICISMFLLACSEEQQPQTISLEELAGETGGEEITVDTVQAGVSDLPPNVARFVNGQAATYSTLDGVGQHSIDRFGYSTSKKVDFFNRNLSIEEDKLALKNPSASLYYYTFADTTATKNAFYNWLDCFGDQCISVKLKEDIEETKISPMFTLVYDTCIVAVDYNWEHKENNWKQFQDSLLASFGKNYNYRIDVARNGPLKWKAAKGH